MRGRLTSGIVAAVVLGTLIIGSGLARTASAFEWDLPGERKLSIHGFYETRLLFVGSELPVNGATWSSLRQVLSTEVELTLFPDGFGPFDSMFLFSRFLVSYDCIYTRACGLANSADSYGDDDRSAVRQPLSLKKDVKNNQPFFAGLIPQTYRPGSLTPSQETLNPGRRYRDCENPPGVFSNPFPLAVFCNLNNRSPLDGPINQSGVIQWETRAGSFMPTTRPSLTAAARPTIGETEFTRLQNLLIAGEVLSISQNAYRSALLAEASETTDPNVAAALNAEAAAILGTPQSTFDANIPELLATRPDPNVFAELAGTMAPALLDAQWGSSRLRNLVWPFLATIDTPIRPQGYFSGVNSADGTLSANTIRHYDNALATNIAGTIGGLPEVCVEGACVYSQDGARGRANPFFLGPDGRLNTDDDLPYVATNARAQEEGYALAPPIAGTTQDRFDSTFGSGRPGDPRRPEFVATAQINTPSASTPGATKLVELYGVYSPERLVERGCFAVPGAIYNRVTGECVREGVNVSELAAPIGCVRLQRDNTGTNIGRNADGACIQVNTFATSGAEIQFEVIGLLGDLNARPELAINEPLDATDLRAVADGGANNTMPARPRAADNGIDFQSPGERRQYEQYHHLVSNLDLKYSVDELEWNHGASQTTKEFAEGYLEMELADSQVYARLGKLIVVWGKTELFRNQDRNNPLDIGNGIFAPLEEQRVGQWALDLTLSPEMFMRVGPFEDLRLEFLTIFNPFEPTDLGKCGEGTAVDLICLKSFGAMANGLAGIGVIGEHRPYDDYAGVEAWDFGARLEGRFDRFTFAISDFWGWDDGFYLDLVQQYERTSDPLTGAPLSVGSRDASTGCSIRTNSDGAAVGPDGRADTTSDNGFPSSGNCLLWNPPGSEDAQQTLRSAEDVAALQNVNQTLFHSLCAYTFDPDEGFCAFDRLNYPEQFGLISYIIGGLGALAPAVLSGVETIQFKNLDGTTSVSTRGDNAFLTKAFLLIEPLAPQTTEFQDLGTSLQPAQAGLLGCGADYASPCSVGQQQQWSSDPVISDDLTRVGALGPSKLGGIDLMNADASVVTQDFVGLKALSPGALVGTRVARDNKLYYQAGIDWSRDGQQDMDIDTDFTRQGQQVGGPPVSGIESSGEYLDLTPQEVIDLGTKGRAEFQIQAGDMKEADGWIEPMPWTVNQEMLDKFGAIVFNADPNNPLDLDSPLNRWNLIDPDQDPNDLANIEYSDINGEYCAQWMNNASSATEVATPFNLGCTVPETISANFERLLIALEIIGFDRVFDAPESLQELSFWSQSNTARQAAGDPISGPDGIFARNQYVLNDEEVDFDVITVDPNAPLADYTLQGVVDPEDPHVDATEFLRDYDPNTECPTSLCYMQVNNVLVDPTDARSDTSALVLAMPIAFDFPVVVADPESEDGSGYSETGASRKVNLAGLQTFDLSKLRRLLSGQAVDFGTAEAPELLRMTVDERNNLFGIWENSQSRGRDMDNDGSADLDRNADRIWDGQDDYLAGPITDDNILCGSGIPGDELQAGVQYSPYRAEDAPGSEEFNALFPNGLPPRSPVFCRGVSGILSATSQTLPVRRAGGNGTYGRRDFLWQGGRQVAFNYQKRNVFGWGLDFAEDTTKTSWGLEFSWMANKLIPNTLEYDGLSQSDEMVLSISVDRPTFFNFLNPNRSFFMNLQMFLRYIPNYEGGKSDGDGNYPYAGAPVTGNIAFTFFTGYFQDRLAPRVTLLYAPWESQGALITGLSYRWNDAFSTSIGWTQFFGHIYDQQGSIYPIAQYGSVADYTNPVLRGVAPVIYRDQAEVRIRYTW